MDDETQQDQASPEVRARINASFERQGLMRHLGAHLSHIAPGRVHIVLPGRPEVTQQHGYFHVFPEDTAVGTVLRSGRTLTVCQLEAMSLTSRRRAQRPATETSRATA
jgi:acyl-coenzyme A thioesterase PaaI-like protein